MRDILSLAMPMSKGKSIGHFTLGFLIGEDRYRRLFPNNRTVHWFMTCETRKHLAAACLTYGDAFVDLEDAKEKDSLIEIQKARMQLHHARLEFLNHLVKIYASDPYRLDLFCRPSVMTRVDHYLFLDGIPKSERKAIIRDFRRLTDVLSK